MKKYRLEKDSLGEVRVPEDAYWGAQTQRAIENFPISGIPFPVVFIRSLGYIKLSCAKVNFSLRVLDKKIADAITQACNEVIKGKFDDQFPLDIFQTGSGTSTNMNANEVIATRANEIVAGRKNTKSPVHPNDHVNMGQSSNDVIPTAIHVAACLQVKELLLPSLELLYKTMENKSKRYKNVVKTGRTHLMDAMPITLQQEMSGWATQIKYSIKRINTTLPGLSELAIGGTAVGTGINTHPGFGKKVSETLSRLTGIQFKEAQSHFEAQSSQDAIVELSGQLKTLATSLMKISNDMRWMNSGPITGLSEIRLPSLQPGSSIMPGKVNPVIPEAVRMVCAQVIGNDAVISIANSMGDFQLNVMLPVIAHNIIQSITIIANASQLLAEKAIKGFEVNEKHILELINMNPIIATVLNPIIGYDKAAEVVKKALKERKTVKQVVVKMGYLSKEKAEKILKPEVMTKPGFSGRKQG
ncbi:MAG: class II fumarate hydratase [Nitrospirota bacterium]|nr:class II fumarate hydratase [Nitrospirota bacterium]MDH5768596.1 class II fumarate hydratase [Nitrospirota bacterium]